MFIHVKLERLEDPESRNWLAHGENLKEALQDLRDEFWHDLRPPIK